MLVICLSLLHIFGLYICRSLSSALLHSCFCYSSLVGSRFLPCIYFFLAVAPICRATREYRLPFLYNCNVKRPSCLGNPLYIDCLCSSWVATEIALCLLFQSHQFHPSESKPFGASNHTPHHPPTETKHLTFVSSHLTEQHGDDHRRIHCQPDPNAIQQEPVDPVPPKKKSKRTGP